MKSLNRKLATVLSAAVVGLSCGGEAFAGVGSVFKGITKAASVVAAVKGVDVLCGICKRHGRGFSRDTYISDIKWSLKNERIPDKAVGYLRNGWNYVDRRVFGVADGTVGHENRNDGNLQFGSLIDKVYEDLSEAISSKNTSNLSCGLRNDLNHITFAQFVRFEVSARLEQCDKKAFNKRNKRLLRFTSDDELLTCLGTKKALAEASAIAQDVFDGNGAGNAVPSVNDVFDVVGGDFAPLLKVANKEYCQVLNCIL